MTSKDERRRERTAEMLKKAMKETPYGVHLEKCPTGHYFIPWFRAAVEDLEAERLSDTSARAVWRFPVQHEYTNPNGNLMGGMQATMFDIGTGWVLALLSRPGFWRSGGVTRSLNVTYLRPSLEGEWLRLECDTVHVGKRLCLLRGTLKREKDDAIISLAEHTMYDADAEAGKM